MDFFDRTGKIAIGSRLRMLTDAVTSDAVSYTHLDVYKRQHQWCVRPGPLVLRSEPLNFPTPTEDRGPNSLATF